MTKSRKGVPKKISYPNAGMNRKLCCAVGGVMRPMGLPRRTVVLREIRRSEIGQASSNGLAAQEESKEVPQTAAKEFTTEVRKKTEDLAINDGRATIKPADRQEELAKKI
ncbi:unnamed protein product [Caenorhabditis sp. 36 PRJEB53466]|nr:unnamed protein product [Caenorhabditis sp. 36 PRJEB53466]